MSGNGEKGMNAFDDVTDDTEPESNDSVKQNTHEEADDGEVVSKSVDRTAHTETEATAGEGTPSEDTGQTRSDTSHGIESPSFTHEDIDRECVYIFTETWDDVVDMRFDVRKQIREQEGVRNIDNREIDEAMLTLAMQELDTEDIADLVLENRKNPP